MNRFNLNTKSTLNEFLDKTSFFIEATDNERANLRLNWMSESCNMKYLSVGFYSQIGSITLDKQIFPIVLNFNFAIMNKNNILIAFYFPSSRFCDWEMIDNYIKLNYLDKFNDNKIHKCNVDNFRLCYSYCTDIK